MRQVCASFGGCLARLLGFPFRKQEARLWMKPVRTSEIDIVEILKMIDGDMKPLRLSVKVDVSDKSTLAHHCSIFLRMSWYSR